MPNLIVKRGGIQIRAHWNFSKNAMITCLRIYIKHQQFCPMYFQTTDIYTCIIYYLTSYIFLEI